MSIADARAERNKSWQERNLGSHQQYGGSSVNREIYEPGSWQERNLRRAAAPELMRAPASSNSQREQADMNSERWENEGGTLPDGRE